MESDRSSPGSPNHANLSPSDDTVTRTSLVYLVARGFPGIINLLALALYTRLLAPDAYGQYALVIAGVGLAGMAFTQWLRLGVLRFFPAYEDRQSVLLSTVMAAFIGLVAITALGAFIAVVSITDNVMRGLVVMGLALLWIQSFYELNLALAVIQLAPRRFGLLSIVKSTTALLIGSLLAYWGFGARGLILGMMAGMLVAIGISAGSWRVIDLRSVNTKLGRELLVYGLPLSATLVLGFVISSSDRFLLGWFLGTGSTGMYAAGYDIASQSIGVLMMVVNLAAYPLAVRALERGGEGAARRQLAQNIVLLLGVALPCSVAFAVLAPNITGLFLGSEFRSTALVLIPWIALGALAAGIRAYYFDLSFQLGRHTIGQVWVSVVAASVNIALNLFWIPRMGILGAAYATVVAYIVALALSGFMGRRIFVLPFPTREALKLTCAVAGMASVLWTIRDMHGVGALLIQVVLGSFTYGLLVVGLDVADVRAKVWDSLKRVRNS